MLSQEKKLIMNKKTNIEKALKIIFGKNISIKGLNAIEEDCCYKYLLYYPKESVIKIYDSKIGRGVIYDKDKEKYDIEILDYKFGKITSYRKFNQGSIYACIIDWLGEKFNLEEYNMETYFEIPVEDFKNDNIKFNAIDLYLFVSGGCNGNKKMYNILEGEKWEFKLHPHDSNDDDIPCVVIQDPTQW